MSMLKDAFAFIADLVEAKQPNKQTTIDGRKYFDRPLHLLADPKCKFLTCTTLEGIVDYIDQVAVDDKFEKLFVNVTTSNEVRVYDHLDANQSRNRLIVAECIDVAKPGEHHFNVQDALLHLLTCYQKSDERDAVIEALGSLKVSDDTILKDDGVSQTVQIREGIAQTGKVKVQNPVMLVPLRSFNEIDLEPQPFVIRFEQNGSKPRVVIQDAGGDAWRVDAVQKVKDFLRVRLPETPII